MRVRGEWVAGADKVDRPFVRVSMPVLGGGLPLEDDFLVSTGADLTVINRATLDALGLAPLYVPTPGSPAAAQQSGLVRVALRIELLSPTDPPLAIPGIIHAAIDPAASSQNVLGLDLLRRFHVVLSHQRGVVLLLDGAHAYQVTGPP